MKTDIYTLAHEVKNPLCVVKGYLEMLNENNFFKYKDIIQEELNNSILILDNYLELRKMVVQKEIMDINLLLLDIKKSFVDYLKKQNVILDINIIDDEIYVFGDYNKLRQVFINIIKNALEAKARNILISYKIFENKIIISIKNDGLFMISDDLINVGNNYSNKVLGNGIGITLSKKIIEEHGGVIEYKNNDDYGVNVLITLLLN